MRVLNDLKEVFGLASNIQSFMNPILSLIDRDFSSGYDSKLASSGDDSQLASSGSYSQLASSGNYSKLASSGDYSQLASSGNRSQLASSGNRSQLASTGKKCALANIGIHGKAKAEKGSWITLVYYSKNTNGIFEVEYVKSEYVDGDKIKADAFYCLYKKEFREVHLIDNIETVVLRKKGNVSKVWLLGKDHESYLVENDGIYAHGKTLKEARESLLYKIGDRDTSFYDGYTIETVVTKQEAIKMYRVITGACEYGVKTFVDNQKTRKRKFTVQEIIELTKGQYGHDAFSEFFSGNFKEEM